MENRVSWRLLTCLALAVVFAPGAATAKTAREYYEEGVLAMEQEKWSSAAGSFRDAIEEKKNYAEAYNKLGQCLFNQAKYPESVTEFKHAVFQDPRYTEALYHLGYGFEKMRKLPTAVDKYRLALAVEPVNDASSVVLAHFRLGMVLKHLAVDKDGDKADLAPAIAEIEEAIKGDLDFSEAYNEQGRLYDMIGRYPEAVTAYDNAIKFNENYAEAYSNRGVAFWHDKNWDNALRDCRKAVEMNAQFAGGHFNLAEVIFAKYQVLKSGEATALYHDEVEKAIDEFKIATRLDPKFAQAWVSLGKACHAYHDYDNAVAAYQAALKVCKDTQKEILPLAYAKADIRDLKSCEKASKDDLALIKKEQAYFVEHLPKPKKKAEGQ